uniref:Uncharacterized protein n=1 Tax=Arundo donax TaxID=35708 RepID=A0A0A8YPC0_ARUDO
MAILLLIFHVFISMWSIITDIYFCQPGFIRCEYTNCAMRLSTWMCNF